MLSWLSWMIAFWFPWQGGCPRTVQSTFFLSLASIESALQNTMGQDVHTRIDFWSQQFLDAPYAVDPLGEAVAPDTDPLIDFCRFDCETYVETVLALAFSKTIRDVELWMNRMRYIRGIRDIRYRYYTMALHWIPGNEQLGYLESFLLSPFGRVSRFVYAQGKWAPEHKRRFSMLGENAPHGKAEVHYNSLSQLLEKQNEIPVPSLAFLVGSPLPGNPFLIMHMGLVLQRADGKKIFRHASRSRGRMRVEEREFDTYLRSLYKHFNDSNMPRRPVLGLRLYRIREPHK